MATSLWRFLIEFIKHPVAVGAIAPSSKALARALLSKLELHRAKCIVELGPGTGVFTELLVARKGEDTRLVLVESNLHFADRLTERFGDTAGVEVLHASAADLPELLRVHDLPKADIIVCGLPFTAMPEPIRSSILRAVDHALVPGGTFALFQYSSFLFDEILQRFKLRRLRRVWRNLPPAYALQLRGLSGIA